MRKIIILGSSRTDGNTAKSAKILAEKLDCEIIDLTDYKISQYDYENKNREDDYLPLMRKIIENYDLLIFATPVYWYSMSGIMKVFFDRITDLLTIQKDLGRKLRGKQMAVLSCSLGGNLEEHFWLPFKESANYLGMTYMGNLHTFGDKDNTENITSFADRIQKK